MECGKSFHIQDFQALHKAVPLFSGTETNVSWNICDVFKNLFLKTSTEGLILLLSVIILLSSFETLFADLIFSGKESFWLPSFSKNFLSYMCPYWFCAVSLNKSEIRLVDQKMVPCYLKLVNQSAETWDCVVNISICYYLSLLWNPFPKWRWRTSMDVTSLTARTPVTISPELEKWHSLCRLV